MYSWRRYLHFLVHNVGCGCTLDGVTFSYLRQKHQPRCTLNGVTFTYLQQRCRALILDNVVLAPFIVANSLLQPPQTKGHLFPETYGEHFGSKAGVLITELPSPPTISFSNPYQQRQS